MAWSLSCFQVLKDWKQHTRTFVLKDWKQHTRTFVLKDW